MLVDAFQVLEEFANIPLPVDLTVKVVKLSNWAQVYYKQFVDKRSEIAAVYGKLNDDGNYTVNKKDIVGMNKDLEPTRNLMIEIDTDIKDKKCCHPGYYSCIYNNKCRPFPGFSLILNCGHNTYTGEVKKDKNEKCKGNRNGKNRLPFARTT